MDILEIRQSLLEMQDAEYKAFSARLIPNVDSERIIGVRIPLIRAFAKRLSSADASAFMAQLPHFYYEENCLHAFLIEKIKTYDECTSALERFLPFVDNWSTCDTMSPKLLGKNRQRLIIDINRWLASPDIYAVRFAVKILMSYYLDEAFCEEYLYRVAAIKSDEYYINMMSAWYFATALAKQYDAAVSLLKKNILPIWVQNKAIQKAVESRRVSDDKKEFLKSLKRR